MVALYLPSISSSHPETAPTPLELDAADAGYIEGIHRAGSTRRPRRLLQLLGASTVSVVGHYQRNCPKRASDLAMMSDAASPQQSI
jgi:hypothetical protein